MQRRQTMSSEVNNDDGPRELFYSPSSLLSCRLEDITFYQVQGFSPLSTFVVHSQTSHALSARFPFPWSLDHHFLLVLSLGILGWKILQHASLTSRLSI